jgi:hypothetical protein
MKKNYIQVLPLFPYSLIRVKKVKAIRTLNAFHINGNVDLCAPLLLWRVCLHSRTDAFEVNIYFICFLRL